jgi:hypothetical protein
MAAENFKNRSAKVMIPPRKATQIAGFGIERFSSFQNFNKLYSI